MNQPPRVAFVCVHNSCRSQMAEAIARQTAEGVFEAYSAGTDIDREIHPLAIEAIQERFGIDLRMEQHPKSVDDLPPVDIVITMGCNVVCPSVQCSYQEDWGLDDPADGDLSIFRNLRAILEIKVADLTRRIRCGLIPTEKINLF